MSSPAEQRAWLPPVALFLLALSIRVAIAVWWRFDGLYGQDAFAYFNQGVAIAGDWPPPATFFWPNGYPLLIALATTVTGPTPLAAQVVSLTLGAAVAPLCYLLARDLFPAEGQAAGWLAGLIVATAGQPILSSTTAMSDMPALFWAVLAAWLLVRAVNSSRQATYFATGVILGFAIVTRWLYVLLTPAFIAFTLYRRRNGGWRPALAAVPGGLLVLLPQLALSLNRPESLLHDLLLGWSPANFVSREFMTPNGSQSFELPTGAFYAQTLVHPAYIFPLLGVAALLAIAYLWRGGGYGALLLLLGWAIAIYLFLGGIPFENFRFNLALYPPLVLLAALGAVHIRTWLNRDRFWRGLVVASLLGALLWAIRMNGQFLAAVAAQKEIVAAVTSAIPAEKTLVTFGLTLTAAHYSSLPVHDLFLLKENDFDALATGDSYYVLVDEANIAGQWAGLAPQQNLRRLAEEATLSPVDQFGPYTLFWALPVGEVTFGAHPMLDAERGP